MTAPTLTLETAEERERWWSVLLAMIAAGGGHDLEKIADEFIEAYRERRAPPDPVAEAAARHEGVPVEMYERLTSALERGRRERAGLLDCASPRCAPTDARPDQRMECDSGCGVTPHRWRPAPEAGPGWRCSECGEVTRCAPRASEPTAAMDLVADERAKQRRKWGDEHDDTEHSGGGALRVRAAELLVHGTDEHLTTNAHERDGWGLVAKHGADDVRALTVAAALAVAELERVLREASPPAEEPDTSGAPTGPGWWWARCLTGLDTEWRPYLIVLRHGSLWCGPHLLGRDWTWMEWGGPCLQGSARDCKSCEVLAGERDRAEAALDDVLRLLGWTGDWSTLVTIADAVSIAEGCLQGSADADPLDEAHEELERISSILAEALGEDPSPSDPPTAEQWAKMAAERILGLEAAP